MLSSFILTLQFFTRIPLPIQVEVKDNSFVKGLAFLPVVGLIIGGINVLIYMSIYPFLGQEVGILSAILCNILLTGALHVDGLADTCDGIYSSRSKERMLEIMKDSRVGTNGVIAIVFDLAFRYLLLTKLGSNHVGLALLLSPIIAKTGVGFLIGISKCGRKNGLGALYLSHERKGYVLACMVIGTVIATLLLGWIALGLITGVCLLSWFYRNYITKKIDGMTGDTLGAYNEILEIVLLGFLNILL